jgi:hypothetical protein
VDRVGSRLDVVPHNVVHPGISAPEPALELQLKVCAG